MRTWTLVSCLVLVGCSGRMVGPGRDSGPETDAGPGVDGGPGVDAGRTGVDAGPPPPTCVCPAFPTACNAPAANEPTFTPGPAPMASQIFDLVACATTSLHITVYEGDWPCITEALATALENDPDLTIDVVVDDGRCPAGDCIFDALDTDDRVTVVRDNRASVYMHQKWIVADGSRVWVTSSNFSERSFCEDHNNAIIVDDPAIVARYEATFQRLFTDMTFGPVMAEGPTTSADNMYSVYMGPESITGMQPPEWFTDMIAAIDAAGAGDRIDVMINAWTKVEVATALIAARDDGADVQVVVAHTYANDAPAQAILAAGIPIRRSEIHDKVIVIGDLVITGSANWSDNAFSNNENVLWIRNPEVAAAYRTEIDDVFAFGRTVDPI